MMSTDLPPSFVGKGKKNSQAAAAEQPTSCLAS